MTITAKAIAKMSNEERLKLLMLLLESMRKETVKTPVPDWHLAVIRERMARMKSNPQKAIPAEKVFTELKKKYGARSG
ncbi:hypothetical protein PLCT1_02615 [Planctomycetaceae bacterium]|nr:hypothetical protein PLCT1_02615 [Planctomycetaceae bacterium]